MKFYYDLMSQPSRALYIFFKLNKQIPVTYVPVNLGKGEHLTEEFKNNINRFQKAPCIIEDDGWKLAESVAIFRYLTELHDIEDHWYPKDVRSRALVDEYLEWQHTNTRSNCAMYFWHKKLIPMMTGKPINEQMVKFFKKRMEETLDTFENVWLKSSEKQFLTTNEISFADILAACELEQPKMAEYNPFDGSRPKLVAWYERVKKITNPHYEEAHVIVNKIASKPKL